MGAWFCDSDENLCRSELSVAQRAHYSKRRKEIWEALHPEPSVDYGREDGGEAEEGMDATNCRTHPETDAIGRKKSPQQTKGFAASTAEVTGENVRQIQRNVARAEAIGDDLLRLTGTSLDKGVAVLLTQTDYESVGVDPISPMKPHTKNSHHHNL